MASDAVAYQVFTTKAHVSHEWRKCLHMWTEPAYIRLCKAAASCRESGWPAKGSEVLGCLLPDGKADTHLLQILVLKKIESWRSGKLPPSCC